MSQIKLNIETKTQKYPIYIGKKVSANISQITKSNSINFNRCLLVVDSNVPKKFILIMLIVKVIIIIKNNNLSFN